MPIIQPSWFICQVWARELESIFISIYHAVYPAESFPHASPVEIVEEINKNKNKSKHIKISVIFLEKWKLCEILSERRKAEDRTEGKATALDQWWRGLHGKYGVSSFLSGGIWSRGRTRKDSHVMSYWMREIRRCHTSVTDLFHCHASVIAMWLVAWRRQYTL